MAVWTAARRDRQPGGNRPVSGAERRFARAAAAHLRFNPAPTGRIAGSVAAQRTREQELAASGADGTRVRMLPANFTTVSTAQAPHPRAGVLSSGRV